MKWEYRRVPSSVDEVRLLDKEGFSMFFNKLGGEGWEIIYVGSVLSTHLFYLLKRPVA